MNLIKKATVKNGILFFLMNTVVVMAILVFISLPAATFAADEYTMTVNITGNASLPESLPTPTGLLRVQISPEVPTRIYIDGIYQNDWSLDWVEMPPGAYILSFSDVDYYEISSTVTVNYYPGTIGNIQSLSDPVNIYADTVTEVIVYFIQNAVPDSEGINQWVLAGSVFGVAILIIAIAVYFFGYKQILK